MTKASDLIGPETAHAMQYVESGGKRDPEAMLQLIRRHAEEVARDVWPAGTVKIGENTHIELSSRMKTTYGYCYYKWTDGHPRERYALIRIRETYALHRDVLDVLMTVRHEMIHAWQWLHPDGSTGHGPTFKQWLSDCDVEYNP